MRSFVWTVASMLLGIELFALPIGNVSDANLLKQGLLVEGHDSRLCDPCISWCEAWSLRFGFSGDYVFNRNMEVNRASNQSDIRSTEIYTNGGYLALNFYDRFDLFGTVGGSQLFIKSPRETIGSGQVLNEMAEAETKSGFSWSVGGRVSLCEWRCFTLGGSATYFYTKPELDFARVEARDPAYFSGQHLSYKEAQGTIGVAYRLKIACWDSALSPYIAAKLSYAFSDTDDATATVATERRVVLYDMKSRKHVGYGVGITLVDNSMISFTVEGRFVDERALHLNGQIRF